MDTKTKIIDKMRKLSDRAIAEGREFTTAELLEARTLVQESVDLSKPDKPLTVPGGNWDISENRQFVASRDSKAVYEIRGAGDDKSYPSMFGNNGGVQWRDMTIGFFDAAWSGRHHPDLQTRAMTEGVPSDGGFLVPSEHAKKIHAVALEDSIVLPRATVVPMRSNSLHIGGLQIGSHASSLFGGFVASYKSETSNITEASPKTRDMELTAKKLTGLVKFSAELQADVPNFESNVIEACGRGPGWYRDSYFLTGAGAGVPLGLKNADCLIVVAKTSGQTASTITYTNLAEMLASLWPGSFKNCIWICHNSTIPQLLSLTIDVGDGGNHFPVLSESNGEWRMLSRPVIFSENMSTLGSEFDICLADFSQYVIGQRQGLRFDTSAHVHFQSDQLLARLIERHDAQPLWSETLTLADGSTEVSPFVTLAERV